MFKHILIPTEGSMPERVVDVFARDGVCVVTYFVLIAAFNRTLNADDFEREALWMAERDKVVPDDQMVWLTAKVRARRDCGARL